MSNVSVDILVDSNFAVTENYGSGITIINNQLFICDKQNNRILIYDLAGNNVSDFGTVGTGDDEFYFPEGITNDGVNLLIVDSGNHRIKKHATDGTYIDEFGELGLGANFFNYPLGISYQNSKIYIADRQNNRIKVHNASYAFEFEITGLNFPEDVTVFDNKIIISDSGNKVVKYYDNSGNYLGQFGGFEYPSGLVNVNNNVLVVIDRVDNLIKVYDTAFTLLETFGSTGSLDDEFFFPTDAYYSDGKLYINDSGNNRVKVLDFTIELDIPIFVSEILKLTKQLYPSGRAWWLNFGSVFSKFHEALAYSESRALEAANAIYNAIIPDNEGFTAVDATNWERALGIYIKPELDLATRKAVILRKMEHPGNILARQHYLYLQGELQKAGFNVYVIENRVPIGGGQYEIYDPTAAIYGNVTYGSVEYGGASIGSYTKIANYIDETVDDTFLFGNDTNLRSTFFIGGANLGSRADVQTERKNEFRELILKIKPAQTAGFLLIDYI